MARRQEVWEEVFGYNGDDDDHGDDDHGDDVNDDNGLEESHSGPGHDADDDDAGDHDDGDDDDAWPSSSNNSGMLEAHTISASVSVELELAGIICSICETASIATEPLVSLCP